MSKRIFIIHGWGGNPEEGWFPWLKRELEARGYEVKVPTMPDTEEPKIKRWVNHLEKTVGLPDENTFFIGHSIGCQTILRYLNKLPADTKIGGAVFVAGWFSLRNLETDEEWKIAEPWIETPINLEKIKSQLNKRTAIFSDNDPFVPLEENRKIFAEKLGAKVIIEHNKGHFSGEDGIKELPIILECL
jgi:predicted alpha/beta hydrolase family esterase